MHFLPHFFLHTDMPASQQMESAQMHNVAVTRAIEVVLSARYWRRRHLYPKVSLTALLLPRVFSPTKYR
jgi:hypothetical protein